MKKTTWPYAWPHGQDKDAQEVILAPAGYLLQDGDQRHILLRGWNAAAVGVN